MTYVYTQKSPATKNCMELWGGGVAAPSAPLDPPLGISIFCRLHSGYNYITAIERYFLSK